MLKKNAFRNSEGKLTVDKYGTPVRPFFVDLNGGDLRH